MAPITVPTLVANQLTALRASISPTYTAATLTYSSPKVPYVDVCRAANLLRLMTNLIDAGPLDATGGGSTYVADAGAFTTVNSLVGSKVTFEGNVTGALAGIYGFVLSNTADRLYFAPGVLPASPQAGDHYSVEFTTVDKDLDLLEQGKSMGSSGSNPYEGGPSLINAIMVLIKQLGGTLPSYLTIATANPFHIGSPSAGAGSYGHGGAILIADALLAVKTQLELYTKPT